MEYTMYPYYPYNNEKSYQYEQSTGDCPIINTNNLANNYQQSNNQQSYQYYENNYDLNKVNNIYTPNIHENYSNQNYYQNNINGVIQDTVTSTSVESTKKLSGDAMPHPITFLYKENCKYIDKNYDTSYITGNPPPSNLTHLIYNGYKNSSPKYIRSSLYNVPESFDLLKTTCIPFAITVSPFAQDYYETPLVDTTNEGGPVRCRRCRAYINPHVQFVNGGKSYKCNLCECINDVSDSYFCNLDQTGIRLDIQDRPELLYGTYDLTTNLNYCRNNIQSTSPIYIFMIDVSYMSIVSGMLKQVLSTLATLIESDLFLLENGSGMKIGIITYDSTIHIYCPNNESTEMEIINDLEEPFVSSINNFIVDAVVYKQEILRLLNKIPIIFEDTKNVEIILAPVISTAIDFVSSLKTCAKILLFNTNVPLYNAPGKLEIHNERVQLGTDDDKKILNAQSNFYKNLGKQCVEIGIGIDLFIFPECAIELPSILPLCSLTGGNVYMYKFYKSFSHGSSLSYDIQKTIKNCKGHDIMAKLRCSNGLTCKEMYGNFVETNLSEIILGSCDVNKSYVFEMAYDDKVVGSVYLQFAMLYTRRDGKRLIRVHNLCLPVVNSIHDVFKNADQDALINYFCKFCCRTILNTSLNNVRTEVIGNLIKILSSYRHNCSSTSSVVQLIMPETMNLLPLYLNSLLNMDCVGGGVDITPDDKSYAIFKGLSYSIEELNVQIYPRLFDIYSLQNNTVINELKENYSIEYLINSSSLVQTRCSYDNLHSDKIYLLENGCNIYLWIGASVNRNILSELFGCDNYEKYIGVIIDYLPATPTNLCIKISELVQEIRKLRNNFMRIYICQQSDKSELIFKKYLVEDRGYCNNSTSYVEFLCLLHQEIRRSISD